MRWDVSDPYFDPHQLAPDAEPSRTETHWYTAGEDTVCWIRDLSKYPGTPTYILERLAKCTSSEIRMAVGDHPNTSLEVLWLLTDDHDVDVRFSLAENHNLDLGVLSQLTQDSNPYVATRAQKTIARVRCS